MGDTEGQVVDVQIRWLGKRHGVSR